MYSAELQTSKQILATSNYSTEFTYSDFPCHFKVNRNKLALIKRRWNCKKKYKGWRLPLVYDNFTRSVSCSYRDRGQDSLLWPLDKNKYMWKQWIEINLCWLNVDEIVKKNTKVDDYR